MGTRSISSPVSFAGDTVAWLVASGGVVFLRYGVEIPLDLIPLLVAYSVCAILISFVLGYSVFLTYRGGYQTGSFEESTALVGQFLASSIISAVVTAGILFFVYPTVHFPLAGFFVTPLLALIGALFVRFWYRASSSRRFPNEGEGKEGKEDVLIIGAGYVGGQLVRLMKDPLSEYNPIGLIDDDLAKRNLRLEGVKVLGTTKELVELCRAHRVDTVLVGIASLPIDRWNELSDLCLDNRIRLKATVPVKEITGREYRIRDIDELQIDQILRRKEIETDLSNISRYVTDKVVLITGAGGSIGSELSKQIHKFGPKRLVLLDRDESALHTVQLDIYHQGLLNTRDMVLCDIRDREALRRTFELHRPEVVFHAAALKHLPMLELYPEEGWKTNVLGSKNVIDLCAEYDVDVLVNVSTDKAADPTSTLGRTKRLAEQMTAAVNMKGRFVSVRFGNVLGSRGSMLWTFKKQIESGSPVTVTHPDVDRYFMTIPEACQLVLQAGAIGRPGEAMVLDMGEPVKILDVARRMIAQYDARIEVVFTGLRPGEKLSEDLIAQSEEDVRPFHPLISHVNVPPIPSSEIESMHAWAVGSTSGNEEDTLMFSDAVVKNGRLHPTDTETAK